MVSVKLNVVSVIIDAFVDVHWAELRKTWAFVGCCEKNTFTGNLEHGVM